MPPKPDVGNGYLLYVIDSTGTYIPIASQRSMDISRNRTVIDGASKTDPHAITLLGRKQSQITLGQAIVPDDAADSILDAAYEAGLEIYVRKYRKGVPKQQAQCVITGMDESFPDEEAATRSITIQVQSPGWSNV